MQIEAQATLVGFVHVGSSYVGAVPIYDYKRAPPTLEYIGAIPYKVA